MNIKEILETSKNTDQLKEQLMNIHPRDIAESLVDLEKEERFRIYRVFNVDEMAEIFSYLDANLELLEELNNEYTAKIIDNMPDDDATDLFQNFDDNKQEAILSLVDDETKNDLISLGRYDSDQAGSIMTKNYIEISPNQDVKDAMKVLIKNAPFAETINTLFVVDDGKLVGTLDLKVLITTKSPKLIKEIMNENYQKGQTTDNIEDVVEIIKDYDIYALPIVYNDIMQGIITMDDALDTFTLEAGEDYAKFSGLTSEDDIDESAIKSLKKRIPWLCILLIIDIFVSLIISRFENVISQVTVLVLFQTVILGLAGNSGTQSLAVSVRKISNDELNTKLSQIKHLFNELRIGFFQGLITGCFVFLISFLFLKISNIDKSLLIALIVGLSVLISLSLSSLFGSLIPIIFTKIHIDPAVASGPFITTLNDILSVVVYYGLAFLMLYLHVL